MLCLLLRRRHQQVTLRLPPCRYTSALRKIPQSRENQPPARPSERSSFAVPMWKSAAASSQAVKNPVST